MRHHGFDVIDGDCVMQVVKYKLGLEKIEYNELTVYEEIENELDILIGLNKDIVISNVITPQDIDIYRKILKQRNLNYKVFLLKPCYEEAVERSKTRTFHKSITPEKWIKHFYDELSYFEKLSCEDLIIFNNSDFTVDESVNKILQIYKDSN